MSNIPYVNAENLEKIETKSKIYLITTFGIVDEKAPDIKRNNIVVMDMIAAVSWFSVIAEINKPMAINAAPIRRILMTLPISTAVFVWPGSAANLYST